MKKNTFRCFAIFKSGIENDIGSFLLVHRRGCKKTFANTERKLRTLLTERNYDNNNQFQTNTFNFDNWYAIKDEKNSNQGIWFAMLCHKGCKPDKVYEALSQLQKQYLKIRDGDKQYYQLESNILKSKYNLETIIQTAEEGYGKTDEGFMSEEDEQPRSAPQQQQQQQQQQFQTPEKKYQANENLKQITPQSQSYKKGIGQVISKSVEKSVITNPIIQKQVIQNQVVQREDPNQQVQQSGIKPGPNIQQQQIQIQRRQKELFDKQNAMAQMQNASRLKSSDGYILLLIILTFIGTVGSGAYVFFSEP